MFFIRNNKRFELFELKVMAALLNAFGLSLSSGGKTSSFFGLPSEPVSKSSIEEWVRRVEVKLSFDPKPHEYPVIAVDSWLSVVKRGAWVSHSTCGLGLTRRRGGPSGSAPRSQEPRRTRSGSHAD